MCTACGAAAGQACCPAATGVGFTCQGANLNCAPAAMAGAPRLCAACGAMGQECCGVGAAANRTCKTGLTCANLNGAPTCGAF